MSIKCGVLTNYQTDKYGKCIRYIECNLSQNIKNPKCPAKGAR